ncbi:M24 family metallopeptidase [Brucella intermedia]|uniref:M24 family peptidase n=1 Tax=Brucella intermedia TaxID=94625 RepID=UPI0009C03C68|nr:M24 family peptidase [Brucella intermedia]KAB2707101.1 M24 family metallopeptidase [Brucella intermedia]
MNRRDLLGMSAAAALSGLQTANATSHSSPSPENSLPSYLQDAPRLSLSERDRRWNIARKIMNVAGVDGLIVYGDRESSAPAPFSPDSYFTNDRLGSIVIFKGDEPPIVLAFAPMAVSDHMQARLRGDQQWLEPEQIFVGKNGAHLVSILNRIGLTGKIGVIGLEPYPPFYFDGAIPYGIWSAVKEAFPKAEFKPVYREYFMLTAAHSQEELFLIRHAAGIGEKMCEAMRVATRPGVNEADIVAATTAECLRNAGFTAEILFGSGREFIGWGPAAWTYRAQPPRMIEEGDVVLAEVFAFYGMYETQHQPAITVGKAHPDFERAAAVARACYEEGLKSLRPGRTFGEVVDIMEAPLLASGGWHVHPLIHSINPYGPIGFGSAPGPESLPEAAAYGSIGRLPTTWRDLPLQEGMSFAFETNCAFDRHLANLGGTVLVGKDGGIELNQNSTNVMRAG